jgi:hypothetical protein
MSMYEGMRLGAPQPIIIIDKSFGRDEGGRRDVSVRRNCWQFPQRKLRMKMTRVLEVAGRAAERVVGWPVEVRRV